uniref:C2H2-type domain-containing protein n=1 Tax=Electrophorus electricus TaxID=8005 RepID=A0AAY5EPD5_ELEEL
ASVGGEVWEEQPVLSAEPINSGDELSGLETALKAEREREEAESALDSPSHTGDGAEGVEFIGLDGLCSSQQELSHSTLKADSSELQVPSATGSHEDDDGEESGQESGDLLHFCPQCGGGFNLASDLAEHTCPLAGEQPHRCELCGKRFTHSRSLERHQLVHTGERPHRCPQCGRSFSRLGNLERHQRIHTGERPYECGACGKRFSRVEYLKRHQQIHSGEPKLTQAFPMQNLSVFGSFLHKSQWSVMTFAIILCLHSLYFLKKRCGSVDQVCGEKKSFLNFIYHLFSL